MAFDVSEQSHGSPVADHQQQNPSDFPTHANVARTSRHTHTILTYEDGTRFVERARPRDREAISRHARAGAPAQALGSRMRAGTSRSGCPRVLDLAAALEPHLRNGRSRSTGSRRGHDAPPQNGEGPGGRVGGM